MIRIEVSEAGRVVGEIRYDGGEVTGTTPPTAAMVRNMLDGEYEAAEVVRRYVDWSNGYMVSRVVEQDEEVPG